MNNVPFLHVRNLWKSFEKGGMKLHVLKGVTLEVQKGTTLGIVGVSGAGKTTLLHIVGTLDRPTEGDVLFGGIDLFSMGEDELADFRRKHIGFIYQSYNLLPEFDALENVMLPFIIDGISREEAEERSYGLLEKVGLKARARHKIGELSGGEQQRVAIARAIALTPSMILADEPTGNLDKRTGKMIMELLLNLVSDEGITLLLVTHNEGILEDFNRVIRLDDGRVVEELVR